MLDKKTFSKISRSEIPKVEIRSKIPSKYMNHSTPTCCMYLLRNRIIGHIFELFVQIYAVDAKRLCVRLGRPLGHRLVPRAGINRPFAGISPVSYGLSQVEIFSKLIGCRVLEVKRSERETQSQNTHAKS